MITVLIVVIVFFFAGFLLGMAVQEKHDKNKYLSANTTFRRETKNKKEE